MYMRIFFKIAMFGDWGKTYAIHCTNQYNDNFRVCVHGEGDSETEKRPFKESDYLTSNPRSSAPNSNLCVGGRVQLLRTPTSPPASAECPTR